jgi:hypothetical protein
MKVYYVEFIISDGTMEEQRLQPIVASSEAKALEDAKEVLENETLEIDGTYKILGIKYIED